MKPPNPEGPANRCLLPRNWRRCWNREGHHCGEEGYQKLRAAIRTLGYVTELLEKQETTLAKLRELLCPAGTEKTEKVLQQAGVDTGEKKSKTAGGNYRKKRAGHGRHGAADYRGAKKVSSSARVIKAGRPMSGCAVQRQSLRATRTWRAGADQRAGAASRNCL